MLEESFALSPDVGKSCILAVTSRIILGFSQSMKAPVMYLYGPRRSVCRHSIGVLLYGYYAKIELLVNGTKPTYIQCIIDILLIKIYF